VPPTNDLLYELFGRLRKSGLPLGVDDYLLALELVRGGKGLEDLDQLRFLCRLLWAKSPEDQVFFNHEFARLVEPALRPATAAPDAEAEDDNSEVQADSGQADQDGPVSNVATALVAEAQSIVETRRQGILPVSTLGGTRASGQALRATGSFQLEPRPPMSPREMAGIWRHLRRMQRQGPLVDLDVERTIRTICRTGYFLRPVLQARRRNQARLLVLRDRSGSMDPFAVLLDSLVQSIRRGGLLRQTSLYYFNNHPVSVLARNRSGTGHRQLERVLAEEGKGICVLILSDAGAARGSYRQSRVQATRAFLKVLSKYTYLYCWINPLPRHRWVSSSAAEIARLAPMFPLDREGLIDAVAILRGQPSSSGVRFDAGR
jgi:uncharacterized protein with von Willebrand factor type A (vWA) domain